MEQYNTTSSSGQDSAVYLHLKDKRQSFEDSHSHILARADRWFGNSTDVKKLWVSTSQLEREKPFEWEARLLQEPRASPAATR